MAPPLILLAEDNPTNRFVVEMMLQPLGCELLETTNGNEAVQTYREQAGRIALVLMDISMPEMDGYEATAEIRRIQHETGQHAPIVALTAHALQQDRDKCLSAGMDDYIAKPFREETFREVIHKYIS